jgi:hypothetical protein
MEQKSAEYDRQSAEYDRQSAEATRNWLNQLVRFYNLYKRDPSSVRANELQEMKDYAKNVIKNCKTYHIDYKAKLSPEVRRFYGVD